MKKIATLNAFIGFTKDITSQFLLVFILLFSVNTFAQGGTCENIEPFCAGNDALIFPNCNDGNPDCTPEAEIGPDYSCLGSQPYPAWFYLQIDQPGDLTFDIIQNTAFDSDGNPTGTGLDVDFICWGPFAAGDDLCDYTQLQSFNQVGCSYSVDYIENFTIPNGQTGEIYVLLITNYSQDAGFIKLYQTGGEGTTNCDIVLTCDVTIENGDQTFCDVTETTLTTSTSGPVESYQWYFNNSLIDGATNSTLTISETGDYKVIVNGTECNEPAEDVAHIIIPGLQSVDLGEDQSLCDISSFEITPIIVSNTSNVSYLWSNGETTPTIVVTESGDYNVVITAETCTVTDSISLLFENTPQIDLGEDFETCFEDTIILDASPSNIDSDNVIYIWDTGETTASIIVTQEGTYNVTVSSLSGNCTSQDSITISGRSDLDVSLDDDFKICQGENVTLTATTSEEGVTYEWFFEGTSIGVTDATLELLDIALESFGTYEVVITKGACTGSDEITLTTYEIGNCIITQGLSPEGTPGFNDSLDLEFLNDRTGIRKLQIFNRYGTLVYERNNYINEWVGQDNSGNELPTGTYYYVIDLLGEDDVYGTQPVGWIYLNRDAN